MSCSNADRSPATGSKRTILGVTEAPILSRAETAIIEQAVGPLPPPAAVSGARERIREARRVEQRRTAVLDDDPTGSQTVHGIGVVTSLDRAALAQELRTPGSSFVLTNTRSLSRPDAVALTRSAAEALIDLETDNRRIDVISRSDSTLRGHVVDEIRELDAVRLERTGRGYDATLFAPAYFEAGRYTAGDVHWARTGGRMISAGNTEFAADATFGYRSSNLRAFLAERSGGTLAADDIRSVTLEDIRDGGPERVAEVLSTAPRGAWVVVNATGYDDLDAVVLGVLLAEKAGRSFLYRTGPSFVRAFVGLDPKPPLTSTDVWPAGRTGGHGLVVVGSHTALTSAQLAAAGSITNVELSVEAIIDAERRAAHLKTVAERVITALEHEDVVLSTSRVLSRGTDADSSLAIARSVSAGVVEVVRRARVAAPAWVVAKGGITSHDVAVDGLGIRRAEVIGQMLPGLVSVWRAVDAPAEVVGSPYVVFAGNVGDEQTLAHVIRTLRGESPC